MTRRAHGAYPIWLCVTCGFGVPANKWRVHRCLCLKVPSTTQCPACRDFFPCRKTICPRKETPLEIPDDEPGMAPRQGGVVKSLGMRVKRLPDGRWAVRAPWLDGPAIADTWPEAYWAAVKARDE